MLYILDDSFSIGVLLISSQFLPSEVQLFPYWVLVISLWRPDYLKQNSIPHFLGPIKQTLHNLDMCTISNMTN